jgi:integrase
VYAHYISDYSPIELEMPVRYSLVRSDLLRNAYAEAQSAFRAALTEVYNDIRARMRNPPASLLWENLQPLEPATAEVHCYGTWRHPRLDHIRALVSEMLTMSRCANHISAHNAAVGLAAYLLTLLLGMRPGEIASLRPIQIDLEAGLITVRGKANFAHAPYRLLPIPRSLKRLLGRALEACSSWQRLGDEESMALWMYGDQSRALPVTPGRLSQYLAVMGYRAGLDRVKQDWYAARHFFRSFLLAEGMPYDQINVIMGHQVVGGEFYNPYLNNDRQTAFARLQALSDKLAASVGLATEAMDEQ